MTYLFLISLIQGLGELLPISSSAHLFLFSHFWDHPPATKDMEVALHLGNLLAFLCYFYKPIGKMIGGTIKTIFTFRIAPGFSGAMLVVVATLPIVGAGYYVKRYHNIEQTLFTIGVGFLFFGILALISEIVAKPKNTKISFFHATLIGISQIFSLLPGASRLGVCNTMCRFLGITPWQSVMFSFILVIPTILGAFCLTAYDLIETNSLDTIYHLWPAVLATFAICLCFFPLIKWYLKRYNFMPFAIYRIILGLFLIYLTYKTGAEFSFPGLNF